MGKSFSFFIEMIVKKIFVTFLLLFICHYTAFAQVVYVDCNTGNDNNNGTIESPLYSIGKAAEIIQSRDNDIFIMKINPGIYVLDKHISVFTEKEMTGKRIIIEANILPGDTLWTPEKMPVILSSAPKGEFENKRWVVAFLINESHVTIGIPVYESFSLFKSMRNINYHLIYSLSEEQMNREGFHSIRGKLTVRNLIECYTEHLDIHMTQINGNISSYKNSQNK